MELSPIDKRQTLAQKKLATVRDELIESAKPESQSKLRSMHELFRIQVAVRVAIENAELGNSDEPPALKIIDSGLKTEIINNGFQPEDFLNPNGKYWRIAENATDMGKLQYDPKRREDIYTAYGPF
jgi:hypothetical protein